MSLREAIVITRSTLVDVHKKRSNLMLDSLMLGHPDRYDEIGALTIELAGLFQIIDRLEKFK